MADPALVETLTTLSSQIDTLSDSLAPLLKVPFQELISQQDEPLVKAKLDVLVSYALHDLIWGKQASCIPVPKRRRADVSRRDSLSENEWCRSDNSSCDARDRTYDHCIYRLQRRADFAS
jgi:hypothetical protein